MRHIRKIVFVIVFLYFVAGMPEVVFSKSVDTLIEQTEDIHVPYGYSVADMARSALSGTLNLSFSKVLTGLLSLFFGALKEQLGMVGKITTAGVLCGVFAHIMDEKSAYLHTASGVVVGTFVFTVFIGALDVVKEGIDAMLLCTQSLFPAVTAAVITTGQVSGGALSGMIFAAMQVFIFICRKLFVPWVCIMAVLEIADGFGGERFLKGINGFLKQGYRRATGILLVLYSGTTALCTVAGKAAGTLAGKTVKYAVGSFVPMIGGALADSLELVQTGARAVGGALGVGGAIGVILTGFLPFVNILAMALAVKLSGVLCTVAGEEKTAGMIISTGDALVRLCGIVLSVGVMFVVGIFMLLKAGGSV